MNLDRILQPGTHLEISLGGQGEEEVVWDAQVHTSRTDSFLVSAPAYIDLNIISPVGREIVVWAGLDDARCSFDSLVMGEQVQNGHTYLVLKKPQKLTTSDRRHFVRMKSHLAIKFNIISSEDATQWKKIEPSYEAVLIDLSGVGLSFAYNREIPPDTLMVFALPLEMKNASMTIKILGTVVRNDPQEKGCRVGVQFENVSELQQDLIMKHLFHTMRKYIQISRDDF